MYSLKLFFCCCYVFLIFINTNKGIHRRLVKQLLTTLVRELPFCSIKFPLWEFLKVTVENKKKNKQIETYESAICGSIAGGTAAGLTMPIDLAYKRINVDKVTLKL